MAASRVQSPHSSLDWGNVLAEVNTEDGGSENDDSESDNYEALRGLTLRQLNEAKDVRKIHRSLAYRPINAVEKLAKEGYLINMPIDGKLLRATESIFGKPYSKLKSRAAKKSTKRIKLYDRLLTGCIAVELDVMTFYRHLFLVSCTYPYSHCKVEHLGPTTTDVMMQDAKSLTMAFEKIVLYYTSRSWKISYAVHDSQSGMMTSMFQNFAKRRGIMPVPLPSGDHPHRVERKQGFLKDVCRVIKTGFPTSLPHSLAPHLVKHAEMQVNTTVSQSNVNQKPPQLEVDKEDSLDYQHCFPCSFGDMAIVHKKSMVADKAEDYAFEGIALYPAENKSSGYYFLNLTTGTVVPRTSYEVMPSYTFKARKILQSIYDKDMKKAAKLRQFRGDVDPLTTLRFQPDEATRVAYVSEDPQVQMLVKDTEDIGQMPEEERYANEDDVAEIFYNLVEETVEQKSSFSSIDEYMQYIFPELEADMLICAAQLSLKKGTKLYGYRAVKAIEKELLGIVQKNVFEGVHYGKLSKRQKKLLRSKVILSEKRTADGFLDRIKARLVVLGNLQTEADLIGENLKSPTPAINTVLMQITKAAVEGRKVTVFDVGQAFLNSYLRKDGDEIIMELKKEVADVLIQVDETYRKFQRKDGSLLVKLNKALYGLKQAPRLWYDTFKALLIKDGFKVSEMDDCHFVKKFDDGTSIDLSVHVDDGLATTDNEAELDNLMNTLKKAFNIVEVNTADNFEYLKMKFDIDRTARTVEITQPAYYENVFEGWEVKGSVQSPHTDDLFKVQIDELLDAEKQKRFHTTVAKCLYLAIRTRPDIMVAVSHLTTRVLPGKANKSDEEKMIRLLKYLNGTKDLGIMLGGDENNELNLQAYSDASYGIHADAKSHTGLYVTLGRGPIMWKSYKQKSVTKSSCEAEILALSDMVSIAIWIKDMYNDMSNTPDAPVRIYEDNMAAIHLVSNGMSTSDRSRHIHIRNNYVGQFVENGQVKVIYCPTKDMIADILTKPLGVSQFLYLRDYLLGYKIPAKGCVMGK